MTPAERYQRGAHLVKALDPHLDLDQLFYHQRTRTVRRDGTVRLGNQLYEVDLSLRTLTVQLRFDHRAHRRTARVGFEIQHIGHQQDHFE